MSGLRSSKGQVVILAAFRSMADGVIGAGIAICWILRGHSRRKALGRLYAASREGGLRLSVTVY